MREARAAASQRYERYWQQLDSHHVVVNDSVRVVPLSESFNSKLPCSFCGQGFVSATLTTKCSVPYIPSFSRLWRVLNNP